MSEIARLLSNPGAIEEDPFRVAQLLASEVNKATVGDADPITAQKLILYALEKRDSFGPALELLDELVQARGLFPYAQGVSGTTSTTLAIEAHRPDGMEDVVFHQEQAQVYLRLLAGDNVVLSAPTSFGKSLIIDALIASGRYANVAVVVPTIALIDETRRRLTKRFGGEFKVITHSTQEAADKNLFVMTQERILDTQQLPKLDLFVIDEFYKLDPRRDPDRAHLLNQAFYRLLKTGAQFYMLGPNIRQVPEELGERWKSYFVATNYTTVVSELTRVESTRNDSLEKLVELCGRLHDSTIIYCASPASARRVATALSASRAIVSDPDAIEAAKWLGDHYHPDWAVARALAHGVGVHHGKVPRAIAQYTVRAFNDEKLKFLVCTSTLIEGVNTKAKNIVIFDNRIATKKFDLFTFNNIRGRSGRMFEHFVGHVYLFNSAPQDELPLVDIPMLTQGEETPTSLLIQLDESDLAPASKSRLSEFASQRLLSLEVLRSNSGIDPKAQLALAAEISSSQGSIPLLKWSGMPSYDQLRYACQLIWRHFVGAGKRLGGVSSGDQLAFLIDRLRKTQSVKSLILRELAEQEYPDADAAVEEVLDFVRTWATFHFPRFLMALDRIQQEVLGSWIGAWGDYSFYAASVENLFTSSGVVALEEYGIPIEVSKRLLPFLGDHDTVDGAVRALASLENEALRDLTRFERLLVIDARDSAAPVRAQS